MAKPVSEEELATGGTTVERLRSIVERIERLEEERKALGSDIKDIYTEAKSAGHDVKAVRIAVKRQMETEEKRKAREAVETEAELIIAALGAFADSPLGAAAVAAMENA